jgi:asparagine synthase (glutamine-hydrolysing)
VSAQCGVWEFDGSADRDVLDQMSLTMQRLGPDGASEYVVDGVGMGYRAFSTTKESRLECQPYVSRQKNVLTWDGRLDNSQDLIRKLQGQREQYRTDVAIVMAAFEQWGDDFFRSLIGDWALALWKAADQELLLARDFVGVRHLYYRLERTRVTWSTVLDPLVLLAERPLTLNEEHIASYLASFPRTDLTPYKEISVVPAGHVVTIKNRSACTREYWTFNGDKLLDYASDAEYEEHFRDAFSESIRRRLRADAPVLSELSGGIDSSSIVCMADQLIANGLAETTRLDTISYYDDEEPNWDERPYFLKVEQQRGCTGSHLDAGTYRDVGRPLAGNYFSPIPGPDGSGLEFARARSRCMESNGNRVLLSGIGGDECLGGVPTPIPELADLLVTGSLTDFASQLRAWSLVKRRPLAQHLYQTVRPFLPIGGSRSLPIPWLDPEFIERCRTMLIESRPRLQFWGARPSFQINMQALHTLKKQLGCSIPSCMGSYDVSFPYLDRDLLEFLYSIPRMQILRPGERRSLMRRSLAHLVPTEILNRKRKAYVARGPLAAIASAWPRLEELSKSMISASFGIVKPLIFLQSLKAATHGQQDQLLPLMRTLNLELWLRDLTDRRILNDAKVRGSSQVTQSAAAHCSSVPIGSISSARQQDTMGRARSQLRNL